MKIYQQPLAKRRQSSKLTGLTAECTSARCPGDRGGERRAARPLLPSPAPQWRGGRGGRPRSLVWSQVRGWIYPGPHIKYPSLPPLSSLSLKQGVISRPGLPGQPPPAVHWFHTESGHSLPATITAFTTGSLTSTIAWDSLERQDYGNYSCSATNIMGQVRQSIGG